jgi:hypothetical protein
MGLGTKNHFADEEGQQQVSSLSVSQLSQLRVAAVRSEKLVAEAGDSSETQRKGNVCRWKPPTSNG